MSLALTRCCSRVYVNKLLRDVRQLNNAEFIKASGAYIFNQIVQLKSFVKEEPL